MVFWISCIYFSHLIDCNGIDFKSTFWENGFTRQFDIVWHFHYHDQNRVQSPKSYPKVDCYEFGFDDRIEFNFK